MNKKYGFIEFIKTMNPYRRMSTSVHGSMKFFILPSHQNPTYADLPCGFRKCFSVRRQRAQHQSRRADIVLPPLQCRSLFRHQAGQSGHSRENLRLHPARSPEKRSWPDNVRPEHITQDSARTPSDRRTEAAG